MDEASLLSDVAVVYVDGPRIQPHFLMKVDLPDGTHMMYTPGLRMLTLYTGDPSAGNVALRGAWIHEDQRYQTVRNYVLAAISHHRVASFEYRPEFFIGAYLGLRLWQTFITQLEFRLRVLSRSGLQWLNEAVRPQLDSGKLDIPRSDEHGLFAGFMLTTPMFPTDQPDMVAIGIAWGQWVSHTLFMSLLGDRETRMITTEMVIDYSVECRLALRDIMDRHGLRYLTVMNQAKSLTEGGNL